MSEIKLRPIVGDDPMTRGLVWILLAFHVQGVVLHWFCMGGAMLCLWRAILDTWNARHEEKK